MSERQIEFSSQFKRDVKKHFLALVTAEWAEILNCLVKDLPLPLKYKDHALTNNWNGFRDCHVKPDLVFIYRIENNCLHLVHLNSHSEIFG